VAVKKLREWEGKGLALDEACYAAAIAGCAQAEDWEEAMRLLACVRRLPEPVGDAAVYQNVMYACVRGGRHDDVVAIFHYMVEDGVAPNSRCYMSLLNSLKAKGDWEGALRHVLAGMRCGAIGGALGHTALAMVAGVVLHHGRWREAFELVTMGKQKHGFKSQLKGHNCAKALDFLATRTPQPASWQEMLEFLQAWRRVTGTSPGRSVVPCT
jgi:pentatricopeptide repeat protein